VTDRKRVYSVERTLVERFLYDPEELRLSWADRLDAFGGSFEDFVVDLFEHVDGSQLGDGFFYHDANPSVGIELVERWDDE
jgi:hypothetical protein